MILLIQGDRTMNKKEDSTIEQGSVHVSIIANDQIEEKTIHNETHQQKIIQAKLHTTKPSNQKHEIIKNRKTTPHKLDVREQLKLQREKIKEETERLLNIKRLNE